MEGGGGGESCQLFLNFIKEKFSTLPWQPHFDRQFFKEFANHSLFNEKL